MTSPPSLAIGACAVAAPILLMLYGVLRLVDGSDGDHGAGWAWNLGHALFLASFVGFGGLIVGLWRLVRTDAGRSPLIANVAFGAGILGVGCFCWVILGDLFGTLDDAAPLPEPLELVGPLALQLGWLGLMAMLVATHPRRLPVWSPLLVLVGFLLLAADLDLLPVGALLMLAGLAPLALPVTRRLGGRPGRPAASEPAGSSSR